MRRGGAILLFLLLTGAVFAFLFQYMEKRKKRGGKRKYRRKKFDLYGVAAERSTGL